MKRPPKLERARRGEAEPHTYFTARLPDRLVKQLDKMGPSRTGALRYVLECAFGKERP